MPTDTPPQALHLLLSFLFHLFPLLPFSYSLLSYPSTDLAALLATIVLLEHSFTGSVIYRSLASTEV